MFNVNFFRWWVRKHETISTKKFVFLIVTLWTRKTSFWILSRRDSFSISSYSFRNKSLKKTGYIHTSIRTHTSFLDYLRNMLDFFPSIDNHDNFIVIRNFNMKLTEKFFKDIRGFINLIKNKTCSKGQQSWLVLILTNRKYCFICWGSCEAAESDPHRLKYTVFWGAFSKTEPKFVNYGNYKNFQFYVFKTDLNNTLRWFCSSNNNFDRFFIRFESLRPQKEK